MALKLGFNGKLYYLASARSTWNATVTAGRHVGPAPEALAEISNVGDIEIPIEKDESDVTTRASAPWEAVKGTIRKVSIDIAMPYKPTDAAYLAFEAAFLGDTTIPLAFLDGDAATAGTLGIWADFEVLKMNLGQKIKEVQMVNFTVKLGDSTVPPEMIKVAAGS